MTDARQRVFRPFQRFLRLLSKDRKDIGLIYLYAVVNGIVALSLPLGIQAIVGLILAGRVSTSWVILTVIVTLGVAFSGVLQVLQLSITEVLQQRIFTRASFEFAYRIPRVKSEAIRGVYLPELVNRFFDTLNVQKGLSKILLDLSTSTLQIVLGLALLAVYHPFFIFFGLALLLTLAALIRWSLRPGLQSSLKESTYKYRVAHWLKELARGFSTFKLAGVTNLPLTKTDSLVASYLTHRKQHFRILVFQYAGVVVFKTLITLGLLALGGVLVMQNEITIGQFVASEIIIIFVPIFLPLLAHFGIDPLFFGILVALNLQTSFLTPPMAMSAYYLKGVAPKHVQLSQIFKGNYPHLAMVILAMVIMYIFLSG